MIKTFLLTSIAIIFSHGYAISVNAELCKLSDALVCGENTNIRLVGVLNSKFNIYNYVYIFGQAKRQASRVLILDNNMQLIGIYAPSEPALKTDGNCILFDVPKELGNSICLSNNTLPNQALIDGELIELYE